MTGFSRSGVAPETLLLTSKGYIEIGALDGQEVEVWTGNEFEETTVFKVNTDQPLIQVTTDNGLELNCTEDHKFHIQPTWEKSSLTFAKAGELEKNERLYRVPSLPVVTFGDMEFPHAYTHGFYTGSERYKKDRLVTSRAPVFGYRRPVLEALDFDEPQINKYRLNFPESLPQDFEVPLASGYSIETKLEWLAGLFDGGFAKRKGGDSPIWHLYSDSPDFLYQLKLLLQTLGVDSRYVKNEDLNRAHYSIRITTRAAYRLKELGIKPIVSIFDEPLPPRPRARSGTTSPKIKSLEDAQRTSDIYNFIGTTNKSAVFNGIFTTSN